MHASNGPPTPYPVLATDVAVLAGWLAAVEAAVFTGEAPRDLTRALRAHFVRHRLIEADDTDNQFRIAVADMHQRLRLALGEGRYTPSGKR